MVDKSCRKEAATSKGNCSSNILIRVKKQCEMLSSQLSHPSQMENMIHTADNGLGMNWCH